MKYCFLPKTQTWIIAGVVINIELAKLILVILDLKYWEYLRSLRTFEAILCQKTFVLQLQNASNNSQHLMFIGQNDHPQCRRSLDGGHQLCKVQS